MKRFWKSAIGKTTLFVAFTLSTVILAASVLGIVGMFSIDVYTQNEQTVVTDYRQSKAESLMYQFIYSNVAERYAYYPSEWAEIKVVGNDGNEYTSPDFKAEHSDEEYERFNFIIAGTKREIATEDRDDTDTVDTDTVMENDYRWIFGVYSGDVLVDESAYDAVFTGTVYCLRGVNRTAADDVILAVIHLLFTLRYAIYFIVFAALLLCLYIFVSLMIVAGKRPGSDDIHPGTFGSVPFDLILAGVAFLAVMSVWVFDELSYEADAVVIFAMCIYAVFYVNVFLGLCMSFATRVKMHKFFKGLLIYQIIALIFKFIRLIWRWVCAFFARIGRLFRMMPIVWRTVLIVSVISIAELLMLAANVYEPDNLFVLWILEKLIIVPIVISAAFSLRKLEKAGEKIAAGDLTYKTDTRFIYKGFRRHAENLNSISGAMTLAVEDRTKSERMKTELITNVSHDIKTPLTSIINYANLIGNEQTDNENLQKYSEVLVRQSEKLKRLIEDLVEASKASTGNLEINAEPCDAGMFITQASGEYEGKISTAGLELVTYQPEDEIRIMADTRRMWRVFDNLMNNVCKYSQPGTRVYLSLIKVDGNAVITLKNTSRNALNISPDELMERFVRGDSSRNTEGNGLGLSIAKSLAELQGGTLRLGIDGDLFKAILIFPTIR